MITRRKHFRASTVVGVLCIREQFVQSFMLELGDLNSPIARGCVSLLKVNPRTSKKPVSLMVSSGGAEGGSTGRIAHAHCPLLCPFVYLLFHDEPKNVKDTPEGKDSVQNSFFEKP